MSEQIGVSVCVFTFNYEKYLAQALDSILWQQADFPIEIIIGDDCSTDSTREIAKQYQVRYPDRFVLSFNEQNIGGTRNWIHTINQARGKYVALLDGDDYFTDPLKLQKQVALMETDPQSVLCFHAVEELYDNVQGMDELIRFENKIYTIQDFLSRGWFIRTGTTMFRNGMLPKTPPDWVYDFPYRYDTIMHVFLGMQGHALYIDEVMSVWRKHEKGMSRQLMANMVRNFQSEIAMAKQLDQYTSLREHAAIQKYIASQYSGLLVHLFKTGLWAKHFPILPQALLKSDWQSIGKTLKRKLKG
ncbi:MAG: glycosyltransferase [Bacteroidetes bacterium]|nr:glycosyltransferase [Bacteroidota bacterium]